MSQTTHKNEGQVGAESEQPRAPARDADAWLYEEPNLPPPVEVQSSVDNDLAYEPDDSGVPDYTVDDLAEAAAMGHPAPPPEFDPAPPADDGVYATRGEANWNKWREGVLARDGKNATFLCQYDDEHGRKLQAELFQTTYKQLPPEIKSKFDENASPLLVRAEQVVAADKVEEGREQAEEQDATEAAEAAEAKKAKEDQKSKHAKDDAGLQDVGGQSIEYKLPNPFGPLLAALTHAHRVRTARAEQRDAQRDARVQQWREQRAQTKTRKLADAIEGFEQSKSKFLADKHVQSAINKFDAAKTDQGRASAQKKLQDYLSSPDCSPETKKAYREMASAAKDIPGKADSAAKALKATGASPEDMLNSVKDWCDKQAKDAKVDPSLKQRLEKAAERLSKMLKQFIDGLRRIFTGTSAPTQG